MFGNLRFSREGIRRLLVSDATQLEDVQTSISTRDTERPCWLRTNVDAIVMLFPQNQAVESVL